MTKILAEPGDRWVGTGRALYDSKGRPVRKYEPYFSATPDYESEAAIVQQGVSKVLHYDVLDRVVRVENPDGTETRTEYSAWLVRMFDESDLSVGSVWEAARLALPAGDPRRRAADLSAAHADTPSELHLDVLGRTFLTIADNGPDGRYAARMELDIDDTPLRTIDARGNISARERTDLLDRKLSTGSADGGSRWFLPAADNQLIRIWDELGRITRTEYDVLRRPIRLFITDAGTERLRELTLYGEMLLDPAVTHHVGRILEIYDSAGVTRTTEYDFKGNPISSERRFVAGTQAPDWSALLAQPALADIRAAAEPALGPSYRTTNIYDALNRAVVVDLPDRTARRVFYNVRGLLVSVAANLRGAAQPTTFVNMIEYDAHGRRARIQYANSVETVYSYDAYSLRMTGLVSRELATGRRLQDLEFTYEARGRIVEVRDDVQPLLYFDNAVVRPDKRFVLDAVGRLRRVEGREHPGQQPTHILPTRFPIPHANDAQTLARYEERYEYDEAGNITDVEHLRAGQTILAPAISLRGDDQSTVGDTFAR